MLCVVGSMLFGLRIMQDVACCSIKAGAGKELGEVLCRSTSVSFWYCETITTLA
jgi:hypothetical protein